MNSQQMAALTKSKSEILLDTLTHELGRNALDVAFEMYPELNDMPRAKQEEAISYTLDRLVETLEQNNLIPTAENIKRALQYLEASGAVEIAEYRQANPQNPPAFKPKAEDVEADFFQNAPTGKIGEYLRQKYGQR